MSGDGKPDWWKKSGRSYWFYLVILPVIIIGFLLFLFKMYSLYELYIYFIVTFSFIASAYYLRKFYSIKVWKAIWIIFGVGIVGFPVAIASAIIFIKLIGIPWFIGLPASFILAAVLGGYIGNYIGKRREYSPIG